MYKHPGTHTAYSRADEAIYSTQQGIMTTLKEFAENAPSPSGLTTRPVNMAVLYCIKTTESFPGELESFPAVIPQNINTLSSSVGSASISKASAAKEELTAVKEMNVSPVNISTVSFAKAELTAIESVEQEKVTQHSSECYT